MKTVQIGLEEAENMLDVFLYKDANDLYYFKEFGDKQLTLSPNGGILGFEKIEIYEKVIVCHKLSQLFNVFLRGTKTWLSYVPTGRQDKQFDFYDSKPKLITDDFILLYLEGGRGQECGCFVFEMDSFICKPGDTTEIGLFDEIPVVHKHEEGKTIILSRDKRKSIFLVGVNQFNRIPSPDGYNKEEFQYEFLHVYPSYVVIKRGSDSYPDFFVFSFNAYEYKNIYLEHNDRLDKKYWKPSGVVCNEDYIALRYLSTVSLHSEEWKVLCVDTWKHLTQNFVKTIETDIFDDVSLDKTHGNIVLSKVISGSVTGSIPKRDE